MTNNEDNNNSRDLFVFPLSTLRYRQVFPSSSTLKQHYKSAQLTSLEGQEVAKLRDPYTRTDKYRFEDAYTKDPIVRRCINSYVNFLLGRRTTTTVDINREFMNLQTQENVLSVVLNQQEINEIKTLIDKTNARVKFHAKIEAACVQSFVGGRSALMIESQQGGMPTDLKVLTWSKLGQVFADKDSWEFLGVEYQDSDDPLLARDLIYFANMDYNISPDSLYYGRSMIEPVVDAVETNAFIQQEDLKEASRTSWADRGLVKFPPNTSEEQARLFLQGFLPGVWNSTSTQVELEKYGLDVKLKELIEVSAALDKRIRSGIGTPGLLVGDENVLNYATASMVMHAWRESDLNRYRTWLQDVLEPQWFIRLIQLRFPDINPDEMLIKAKLNFEDMTLETLRDRAESLLPAVQSGYLSPEKFLEVLDFPDEIEKRAAMLEEKQKLRAQQLEQMRADRQQFPPKKKEEEENDNVQQDNNQEQEEEEDIRKRRQQKPIPRAGAMFEAAQDNAIRTQFAELVSKIDRLESETKSLRQEKDNLQRQYAESIEYQKQEFNKKIKQIEQQEQQREVITSMSAKLGDMKGVFEKEEHEKKMKLLEEKAETQRMLRAKIEELKSSS